MVVIFGFLYHKFFDRKRSAQQLVDLNQTKVPFHAWKVVFTLSRSESHTLTRGLALQHTHTHNLSLTYAEAHPHPHTHSYLLRSTSTHTHTHKSAQVSSGRANAQPGILFPSFAACLQNRVFICGQCLRFQATTDGSFYLRSAAAEAGLHGWSWWCGVAGSGDEL